MLKLGFVALKNKIRREHAEAGNPISAREAHRIAQGITLSLYAQEYAEEFAEAAEAYFLDHADETGEQATNRALIAFIIGKTERKSSRDAGTSGSADELERSSP